MDAGGTIEIGFPLDNFTVPTSGITSTISIYNGQQIPLQVQYLSTGLVFTVPQPGIGPFAVSDGRSILLTINGILNPNTMATTKSFIMTTKTVSGNVIDTVSVGLSIKITLPAQITIQSFSVIPRTVG